MSDYLQTKRLVWLFIVTMITFGLFTTLGVTSANATLCTDLQYDDVTYIFLCVQGECHQGFEVYTEVKGACGSKIANITTSKIKDIDISRITDDEPRNGIFSVEYEFQLPYFDDPNPIQSYPITHDLSDFNLPAKKISIDFSQKKLEEIHSEWQQKELKYNISQIFTFTVFAVITIVLLLPLFLTWKKIRKGSSYKKNLIIAAVVSISAMALSAVTVLLIYRPSIGDESITNFSYMTFLASLIANGFLSLTIIYLFIRWIYKKLLNISYK